VSPRARYIARRLLLAIPVIVAMSVFVFLMIHLVPGDPVQTMLGFRATPENVATVRDQLGLDKPLLAQYLTWAGGLLHGDFGQDFISHAKVSTLLAQRLPVTIELTLLSMTLAVLVGVPLGVRAASKPGPVRQATEGFVVAGIAITDFWLGIMLVLLFAGIWQLLPPSGYVAFPKDPVQNLRYLALRCSRSRSASPRTSCGRPAARWRRSSGPNTSCSCGRRGSPTGGSCTATRCGTPRRRS
jgi:peptide/nickel transport system permease protein